MQTVIERMPCSFEEFMKLPQLRLTAPEDTCAAFLCAVELFRRDKEEGTKALNVLRGPRPLTGIDVQFVQDRLRGKGYLPMAYFRGALPENGYTPEKPYVLDVLPDSSPQGVEEGYIRVFLRTAGADSPRPIKLRRKGEQWFLWEYSSPLTGIRPPAALDTW